MWDYIQMSFWMVVPFLAIKHLPHLKLTPAGIVPQRECRPRPIMDYTFNEVNPNTLPITPYPSMPFGVTLPRLLQCLVNSNPSFGPPLLMKVDLADGYYRIPLAPEAALELAVVLPPDNTSTNLIGIPLSLPMGWKNSPPFFCFTETVADIANANLNIPMPPHALEQCAQVAPILDIHHYAISAVLPPPDTCRQTPLQYVNVYIDDFIAAA
jgi:hypothetical protein